MKKIALIAFIFAGLVACTGKNETTPEVVEANKKIVSLNGSLTEIIFALEKNDQLVAVDVTSTFPEAASKLTNLGHANAATAESILSSEPTDVIAFEEEMNPDLVAQLKAAGVNVQLFKRVYTVEGTKNTILEVAKWLGDEAKGNTLTAIIDEDLKSLKKFDQKPSILFIYARGTGMMMVAGDLTPMKSMIELAGGKNAVSGFENYKPLTPEAVIAANPDLLLMFNSGVESINGEAGMKEIPGIKLTTAGKNNNFFAMDGQLLSGFGPRIGKALVALNAQLNEISK